MALHMAFSNFQGCEYLFHINIAPSTSWTRSIKVQDQLLVCRDHFAVLDICSGVDEVHRLGMTKPSTFYQTINLRKTGITELKIRVFSDVSINRPAYVSINNIRDFSCGLLSRSILCPAWSNGVYYHLFRTERPIGFEAPCCALRLQSMRIP